MSSNLRPEGNPSDDHHHGERPESVPSWVGSLFELFQSRIALAQLEAKHAAADGLTRIMMLVVAAFLLVVAWFLLLAAVAGVMHAYAGFAWYWTCLALAGIHLLAILLAVRRVRAAREFPFQYTRSEIQKDLEWLHNLQHRKSKH